MSCQEKFSQNETLEFDGFNETVKNVIANVDFQKWVDEAEKAFELVEFKTFQEQIDAFNKKLKEYHEEREIELKQAFCDIKTQEEILSRTPQIMETRTRMIDNLVKTSLEYALQQFNVLSPEDKKKFLDFVSVEAEDKEKILKKGTLTLNDFGAVVMMGGTGAGYLCPHSDLDIRFVPIEQNSWQEKMANSFLNVFFENVYDNGYIRMGNVYAPEQIQLSGELSRLYTEYSNSPANKNKFAELKDKILEVFEKTKIARNISSNKLRRLIDYFSQYARNRLLEGELFDFEEREKVEEEIRSEIKSENDFESMQNLFFAKIHSDKKICLKNNQIQGYLHSFEDYYSKNPTEYIFQSEMEIPKEFLDALNKPSSANSFREMLNEIKKFNSGVITDVFEHMSMRCACGNQTVFEKYKKDWLDLLLQSTEIESITFADLVKFIALAHMPEFPEIAEKEFDIKEDLLRRAQYYLTIDQITSGRIVARPTHEVLAQYYQNNVIPLEIFQEVHDSIIFLWYLRHLTSYVNKNEKNTINKDSILAIVRNSEICLKEKKEVLNLMLQAVNSRLPFLLQMIFNSMHDLPDQLKSPHVENLPYGFYLQNGILYFEGDIEQLKEWNFFNQCFYYCAHYQCKLDSKIQVKLYEMVRTLIPKEFKFDPVQEITSQTHFDAFADFDPKYIQKTHQILEWMSQDWLAEGIENFYKVYLWLANSGLITAIFPDMTPLKNLWSDKEHRYSSFSGETIASFQAFAEIYKSKKFQPLFAPVLMKFNYFNQILAFATLFHDVGLAVPNRGKKNNSLYDYENARHEEKGAEKFLVAAQKMPVEKYVGGEKGLQKIAFLIQNSHILFSQYGLDLMRADVPSPAVLDHLKEILADNEDLIEMFLLLSMAVDNAKNPADIEQKYPKVMLLYNQFQESKQEKESVKNFVKNCFGALSPKLEMAVQAHLEKDELKAKVTEHLQAYKEEGSLIEYAILEALTENGLKLTKLLEKEEVEMTKLIQALDTKRMAKEIEVSQHFGTYGEVYVSAPEKDFEKKHQVVLRMPDTADALMRFSIYLSFKGFSICAVKSLGIDNDTNLYLIEVEKFNGESFKADKQDGLNKHLQVFCQTDNDFAQENNDCQNCWALKLIGSDSGFEGFKPLSSEGFAIEIDAKEKKLKIMGQGDQKYILARMTYVLHNFGLRINWASLHTSKDRKRFRDVFICDSPIPDEVRDELIRVLTDKNFTLPEMEVCLRKEA